MRKLDIRKLRFKPPAILLVKRAKAVPMFSCSLFVCSVFVLF